MKSAVTTFLTFRLGSQPSCGILALTRVVPAGLASHAAEDARFNYQDVDRGGELRAGAVSYELADSDAAIKRGMGAEFLCAVYNAAAEKLETAYEVIESDASTVTWTPYDGGRINLFHVKHPLDKPPRRNEIGVMEHSDGWTVEEEQKSVHIRTLRLEAIRERNERNKWQMSRDIAKSGTAFMLSEPHPYHDIDTLLAEVERLTIEGKRDYDGMREFQAKFIAADQEVERLRVLESSVIRLETLHGGKNHPQACSAAGTCAIGDVMRLVRQPLLTADAEHDTRSLIRPIPL